MGKLVGSVCGCGKVFLPPRERCLICSGSTQPIELRDVGAILTYTVLHVTPEGFEPPLTLALVQLGEDERSQGSEVSLDPPKLVCMGTMPEDELKIGPKVRVKKSGERYSIERA